MKEMPESELGFTDRWSEQLFKAGPGNRCFAVAAEGNDWPKMEMAGLSTRLFQLHSFEHPKLTPPPKKTPTIQPVMSTKHVGQQTAQQNNRRHGDAVQPPETSLIIKEDRHVE